MAPPLSESSRVNANLAAMSALFERKFAGRLIPSAGRETLKPRQIGRDCQSCPTSTRHTLTSWEA